MEYMELPVLQNSFWQRHERFKHRPNSYACWYTNGPSLYSPYVNEEHAKKRQDLILSVLEHNHLITTKQMQEAQAEELAYVDHSNDEDPSINQYYINAVLEELNKMDISLDQEIQIHTYYQEDVQRSLNNAIRKNMPKRQ